MEGPWSDSYDLRVTDVRAVTDEQLADAAARGDERAFAEIYERHATRLHDFAARLLRNRADAADVVQVTMERAWRNLPKRRADAKLTSWLFTIAHHAAMDVLRRRRPASPIDDGSEEGWAVAADLPDPGAEVSAQELAADVWAAAMALSPTEYAALHHELRSGLSADEIAEVMGMRRGAVYTALSRAKDSLEEAFSFLQLGRSGREECPGLDALLSRRAPRVVDRELRKAIRAHVAGCDVCDENRHRFVAAAELFAALVPIGPAAGLVDIADVTSRRQRPEPGDRIRPGARRVARALAGLGVVGVVALIAAVVLAGGDGGGDDGTPPEDPPDVASTSHTVGEASAERVIVMAWSPGRDPGDNPSGLAGYSHSWTRRPGSLPPGRPTLDADARGVESPELEPGEWWFHLRTFDRAGNSTRTVHAGPFVIGAGRVTVECVSASSHPYWLDHPITATVVAGDGTVRVTLRSTPEAQPFLVGSASDGALVLEAVAGGERRRFPLSVAGDVVEVELRAAGAVLENLVEDGLPFAAFPDCEIGGSSTPSAPT